MIDQLQAIPESVSVDVAPVATSTIVLGDFSFTLPAGFTGKGVVDVSNQGTQVHELNLFKLAPGKTVKDATDFLLTQPGTPPPAGPPPFTEIARHGRALAAAARVARARTSRRATTC